MAKVAWVSFQGSACETKRSHGIKREERAQAPTGVVGGGIAGRARAGAVAGESVPRAGLTRGGAGHVAEGARLAGKALRRVGDPWKREGGSVVQYGMTCFRL